MLGQRLTSTCLQGGTEPSGFFTVSLQISTGTAAQGWDAQPILVRLLFL